MQALKPEHKQYILENEQLIREGNWEEFFKPGKYPKGIGEPLYLANIPFMQALGYVPHFAFYDCRRLTSIVIPNSVTSIGSYAFYDCWDLISVTIGNGVTSIGEDAFRFCLGLTSVVIPDSVTIIGYFAFSHCESLASVEIPNSVISIENNAFERIPKDLVITYRGTKEQWVQIYNKDAFKDTNFIVNCIDGKIVKQRPKK